MFFYRSCLLMLSAISVAVFLLSACSEDGVSAPPYSLATEIENTDAIYYYQIDAEQQEIRLHSNGRCRMLSGTGFAWEKSADVNAAAFRYTFSNDTLYLKAGGESVLVRTSGTPGSLEGTWKVVRYYNWLGDEVPGESEGLTANRQITISGNNFKETNQIASTFDFTKTIGFYEVVNNVAETQDGSDNGSFGANNQFFNENAYDLLVYSAMTNEYTILNRTNTSIEFLRKGQSFLLEVLNPEVTAFSKSIMLKVSSNGKSCVSEYKKFNVTENSCDGLVPAPLVFSRSEEEFFYSAEYSNKYKFRRCFVSLFK